MKVETTEEISQETPDETHSEDDVVVQFKEESISISDSKTRNSDNGG